MDIQHNIFKNSGIRDKVNQNLLTPENIYKISIAVGQYLTQIHQQQCAILIATDTRPSGQWIKKSLAQGLYNHTIYDAGIVPTPCVAKTLKENNIFQLGIMITASHNPPEYNGLKFLVPNGYFTKQDEQQISKLFHNQTTFVSSVHNGNVSKDEQPSHPSIHSLREHSGRAAKTNSLMKFDAQSLYQQHILKQLQHIPYKGLKVVLDCANGATYQLAKKIFQASGIQIIVVNDSNDGTKINLNSGCANPDILIKQVQQHQADWGCAFDGDGDRIIIVNQEGTIFDGDDLLLVLSQHPMLNQETTFIGTIMSNQGIENYLTSHDKKLIRTDVGERNLIQALQTHNAQLASEACGHITIAHHALCSDGIFAALMFFDTIMRQPIPTYQKLHQIHSNISLEKKSIHDTVITTVLAAHQATILPGRAIIRKSNTEPLLRVTVEHEHKESAQNIIELLKKEILHTLS